MQVHLLQGKKKNPLHEFGQRHVKAEDVELCGGLFAGKEFGECLSAQRADVSVGACPRAG